MSEFTGYGRCNDIDFGDYVTYPWGYSKEPHICKVIKGGFSSNGYCDAPYTGYTKETLHDDIVPCLLIIHCGIDETKVIKVRESDCEKFQSEQGGRAAGWIKIEGPETLPKMDTSKLMFTIGS
jgi:hypothetical protein